MVRICTEESSSYERKTTTLSTCEGEIRMYILCNCLCDKIGPPSIPDGTIQLYNDHDNSNSSYSGIVQITLYGEWGNICDDTHYGQREADVICHQLGYTGAASYSRSGVTSYGNDTSPTVLDLVVPVILLFYSVYMKQTLELQIV